MVVLTAYMNLKADNVDDVLAACRIVRAASVLEPGCERYDFFQSPDDATKVVFVEEWTSKADLETHFQQAAFHTFVATVTDLVASPTELKYFESTLISE